MESGAPGAAVSEEVSVDELVSRAQQGDEAAVSQLLALLRPRLRRFGLRLCGQAGEDALQEALLTLSGRLSEFRGQSDIYSWAYTLVRSACSRQTRGLENAPKEPMTPQIAEALGADSTNQGPEARLILRQRSEELNCALSRLDSEMRAAVVLRDVEELRAAEAAQILGISVAALKSRLHRGRKALAQALSDPERSMSGCPDVISGFSLEREGELDAGRCAELREHLAGCPDCLRRCQELDRAFEDARQLPADESRMT